MTAIETGRRIDIDCHDFETCASERHGIRADPAAEIDDPAYTGCHESIRVIVGNLGSRRLFKAGSGEEHLERGVAELGLGRPTQRRLGESSRGKFGTELGTHP